MKEKLADNLTLKQDVEEIKKRIFNLELAFKYFKKKKNEEQRTKIGYKK